MDDRRTQLCREIISFRKTTCFLTACVLRTTARDPEQRGLYVTPAFRFHDFVKIRDYVLRIYNRRNARER